MEKNGAAPACLTLHGRQVPSSSQITITPLRSVVSGFSAASKVNTSSFSDFWVTQSGFELRW